MKKQHIGLWQRKCQ